MEQSKIIDTLETYQWWIASWADDEQYKGKNSLLRLGCSCVRCVAEDWLKASLLPLPTVVASSTYIGPGPLPKY